MTNALTGGSLPKAQVEIPATIRKKNELAKRNGSGI